VIFVYNEMFVLPGHGINYYFYFCDIYFFTYDYNGCVHCLWCDNVSVSVELDF
jgi:hypothetical protein